MYHATVKFGNSYGTEVDADAKLSELGPVKSVLSNGTPPSMVLVVLMDAGTPLAFVSVNAELPSIEIVPATIRGSIWRAAPGCKTVTKARDGTFSS